MATKKVARKKTTPKYTAVQKRTIVSFAKKHTHAAAAKKFNCGKVSIYRWIHGVAG